MTTTANKSVVPSLALAVLALGLTTLTQVAGATHPRPKGASPLRVSLVPAYEQCTASNRTHGPPLAFPSCSPPVQASDFLTVGTPDANGAAANSTGFINLKVVGTPGPPSDTQVLITEEITDVRCKAGTSTCGSANANGGADYTGELESNATLRITDHFNATSAGGGTDPATVIDIPFPVNLVCGSTASTSVGSTCNTSSGPVAMIPDPCSCEGKRMVVAITQLHVFDGGPDGQVFSDDNTLFMKQGIFIP